MPPLSPTPYISTWQGHRFDPQAPTPAMIDIADIAHGLAHQCRFNGQTSAFYSVAQHSLMVAELVPRRLRLHGLLHDAAEAYLGDLVKPLKVLFPAFSTLETRIQTVIGARFDVDLSPSAAVKRADLIALATEKRDLMPRSCEDWRCLDGIVALPARLVPLPPAAAKAAFLEAFQRLRPGAWPDAA